MGQGLPTPFPQNHGGGGGKIKSPMYRWGSKTPCMEILGKYCSLEETEPPLHPSYFNQGGESDSIYHIFLTSCKILYIGRIRVPILT